ncbi:unnamed protein product, partial [Allacma fusca]
MLQDTPTPAVQKPVINRPAMSIPTFCAAASKIQPIRRGTVMTCRDRLSPKTCARIPQAIEPLAPPSCDNNQIIKKNMFFK